MPGGWVGSDRRERLPADWEERRLTVLRESGYRCEVTMRDGSRCRDKATDVDHREAGDDHSHGNLQAICTWHHRRKSSREGNAARVRTHRDKGLHPGLIA